MKKVLFTIVTLCVFALSCTKEADGLTSTMGLAEKKEQVSELLRLINEKSFMVGEQHNKGVVEILKGLPKVTRSDGNHIEAIKQYAMDKVDSILDNCLLKELYLSEYDDYFDSVTLGHSNLPPMQIPLLDPLRLVNLDSLPRTLVSTIDSILISTDTAQVVVLERLYKVIQKTENIREEDVRNMVSGMASIAANSYVFWNELYDNCSPHIPSMPPATRPTFGGIVKADAAGAGAYITLSWFGVINAVSKWKTIAANAAAFSVAYIIENIDWPNAFDFSAVSDAIKQRIVEMQN